MGFRRKMHRIEDRHKRKLNKRNGNTAYSKLIYVSDDVKAIFNRNRKYLVMAQSQTEKKKYRKKKICYIHESYDMLMYLGATMDYMCKRHEIDREIMEWILLLYPINYFTIEDLRKLTTPTNRTIYKRLKKVGAIELFVKEFGERTVFRLSTKASKWVIEFYESLSGERETYPKLANNKDARLIKDFLENVDRPDSHKQMYSSKPKS